MTRIDVEPYLEKRLRDIYENEIVGVRAYNERYVSLIVQTTRIDAHSIRGFVRNRSGSTWELAFDKDTGVSHDDKWVVAYVGHVPGSLSHNFDAMRGFMSGRLVP